MNEFGVILFHTTSSAFAAEKALGRAGVDCSLIPPPREFSSDCGVAVRFQWNRRDEVTGLLDAAGIETAGTHQLLA